MQPWFRYWGKASPAEVKGGRYHLLAFHSLDVAACGQELLKLPRFGASRMAIELGWTEQQLRDVSVVLLALHDIGKFSRAFQGLVTDLGPALIPKEGTRGSERHDTMGWVLLTHLFLDGRLHGLKPFVGTDEFWQCWFRLVAGHHGQPPKEDGRMQVGWLFLKADRVAAQMFVQEVFALLHRGDLPPVREGTAGNMLRLSWCLAGLAVLSDWIGSNAEWFPYQENPEPLPAYWARAQERAVRAIAAAGLKESRVQGWSGPETLFAFDAYTPLQDYATRVSLVSGPQLFLLEDVTGAGKTEAALFLAHRLMAAGQASGLYFALPTMATANQLYERVGDVYTKLYQEGEEPSLVLSHGTSRLVNAFQKSILQDGDRPTERSLKRKNEEPENASAQCAAWLADSRKKAMLAEVGVGTLDQALLATLPVRHQSLRLLGLAHKVLIVDEVHAYDGYTGGLLEALVQAQAMAGGNTILLSATVPATLRRRLVEAHQRGTGVSSAIKVDNDAPYPLATHVGVNLAAVESFATRQDLERTVLVTALHTESEAHALVLRMAREGRAVCWVRNTVEDARRAFEEIAQGLPTNQAVLFHSRFAMGDRLDIEGEVLLRFGRDSGAQERHGQLLIATQVVEQSLDLDFDAMVSDLAPVDLLIQRAGRLHRHVRDALGNRAKADGRGSPVLHILSPEVTNDPRPEWYKALFPRAQYVYQDTGKLWLTLQALSAAGKIVSPGAVGEPGSVRGLIEAVYGEHVVIPPGLTKASQEAEKKDRSIRSQSGFNRLRLDLGYGVGASDLWHEKAETPTRLGDDTVPVYLARQENGRLVPLVTTDRFPWEMSAVRVRAGELTGLTPEWQEHFGTMIDELRARAKLLSEPETLILPLVPEGDGWVAAAMGRERSLSVRYTAHSGFYIERIKANK